MVEATRGIMGVEVFSVTYSLVQVDGVFACDDVCNCAAAAAGFAAGWLAGFRFGGHGSDRGLEERCVMGCDEVACLGGRSQNR